VWLTYWKLARDPFRDPGACYVPTRTHEEAVARLAHAIETGERSATLRAGAGLGKSTVLGRALGQTRTPTRRVARAAGPVDGASLFAALAECFGTRVPAGASRAVAWRALTHAVRVERWQRAHVVIAVDDVHLLRDPADLCDLERLLHLDASPAARVTVITAGRDDPDPRAPEVGGEITLRLPRLTRDEAEHFITAKLASAGRTEPAFTPRAATRLHGHSHGVPRVLDRLSALALMAGAVRGAEIVSAEVVDGAAHECVLPAA
jgi:type II secretory pathway predicted ATPase ExeA